MKAEVAVVFALVLACSWFWTEARGVNISNVWFLPEEGFPVFYRYFNDKVTWNEAEAVCGYHHADLLSVQTNAQMDASRAYLKEIDVGEGIWIGLQRNSPDKPFTWTNGEKVLDDGYWSEPVAKTNEKLCASLDPSSDFRWKAHYCAGPQVFSFVCELPVPEWASKEDGCMITSLPSLTVTYMPEMKIVQLFSDCGLDGTRRIACKGGVNREDMVKRLSCDEDAFASTVFSKSTTDTLKEVVSFQAYDYKRSSLRSASTQDVKSWATRFPQTRHKRKAGSPPSPSHNSAQTKRNGSAQTETSKTVISPQKVNISNGPSQGFPHSPPERDVLPSSTISTSTIVTEKKFETSQSPSIGTPAIPPVPINKSKIMNILTTIKPPEQNTQISLTIKANVSERISRPPIPSMKNEVPVLLGTGENVDDTVSSNTTTENPNPVVVSEKEGSSESYLIPMGEDTVLKSPSLSPMDIADVDIIDLDNFTTSTIRTTTTTGSTIKGKSSVAPVTTATIAASTVRSFSPKTMVGVHPLRLGEKSVMRPNATSSSAPTTAFPSSNAFISSFAPTTSSPFISSTPFITVNSASTFAATSPSTMAPTFTSASPPHTTEATATIKPITSSRSTESAMEKISRFNVVEEDNQDEEMPQRPNRGRVLTRSSNPSFYPYLFGKVLG